VSVALHFTWACSIDYINYSIQEILDLSGRLLYDVCGHISLCASHLGSEYLLCFKHVRFAV
jgi:hypothetical protein